MTKRTVSTLEGDTFVVSDDHGDIDASPEQLHGLFHRDTRLLSRWRLTIDGQSPTVLSTDDVNYFETQFFLAAGTRTVYVDANHSVVRKRAVGAGFHEDLTIMNHASRPMDLVIRIDAASDFADLFEAKDALAKKGQRYSRVEPNRLVLGYRREAFARETWISTTGHARVDEQGLTFDVHVEPHAQWTICLDVVAGVDGCVVTHHTPTHGHGDSSPRPHMTRTLDQWLASAPCVTSDWAPLERIYRRSLIDLAALRLFPGFARGGAVPAAGLPWFMAIFGRDSLITSFQALPFVPELADTTLRTLAAMQGTRVDDFRDEEPGKILHELRFGELTTFDERPHSPYFGSADATPLFLILLDELERWTGSGIASALEVPARAALEWIDVWGDRDGDGYVEYNRRNFDTGLENQCWKDSWNSILFADGSMSRLPRATCEIQGYVYDARVRGARMARECWHDAAYASRLELQAAELKRRFNQDFWLEDREYFALAIDGDGRKVDALTSNIGHLLWSGIVDEGKAAACVCHLLGDRLFSGWGVRTMATGEGGYNPIGYHVGTVWPHDNAIIAWGLTRYGYRSEAAQIAIAMLEAAQYFDARLPEAFAGYPRALTRFPVEYPTACSPQAWASGAPLLFVRSLLGLDPVHEHLLVDPALPDEMGWLQVLDIPGRWGRADAFGRGHKRQSGLIQDSGRSPQAAAGWARDTGLTVPDHDGKEQLTWQP
jgi:glycogen debranching enzyme